MLVYFWLETYILNNIFVCKYDSDFLAPTVNNVEKEEKKNIPKLTKTFGLEALGSRLLCGPRILLNRE